METKYCKLCDSNKPVEDFYSDDRTYCISCERTAASSRMRRYGKTLRGKASQALQTSRKTIKRNGYDVLDDLTLFDVIFTFAMAEGECSYCGKVTPDYTMDHIVALSNNGPNSLANICVACSECNSSKNNRELLVWREFDEVAEVIAKVASRRGVTIAEVLEDFTT